MNDLEINKSLALAIGWGEDQIRLTYSYGVQVATPPTKNSLSSAPWWRTFDYRNWDVIGPIAENYNAFPYQIINKAGPTGEWNAIARGEDNIADTPQKAIAIAVIHGVKK